MAANSLLSPRISKGRKPSSPIPPTKIVDLFLTYDCNFSCPHCFVRDRGKKIDMTPSTLDRSIDWIVETSVDFAEIVFLGGEPTLQPLLIERAVARSRKWAQLCPIRLSFSMTTNGYCLNQELMAQLQEWGVFYIISIDGYGRRHDRVRHARRGASSFEVIKKNVDLVKHYQKKLGARFTVSPGNVGWLADDLARLFRLGFDAFILGPVTGVPWSEEAIAKYTSEIVSFARARQTVNGRPVPELSPIDSEDNYTGLWGCGAGRGRVAIDPLGYIFACGRFAGLKRREALVLGDVYHGMDPTGNIALFQDAGRGERPSCTSCAIKNRCLGGCPAVNWQENHSLLLPAEMECKMNKARVEAKRQLAVG